MELYRRLFPPVWRQRCLARAAAAGAEAFDLARFRRRDVVRAAPHLAYEPLLLHLSAELPKRLLELLGILDDYAHNPERIPVGGKYCSVKAYYSRTSGRTARPIAMTAKPSAKAPITTRVCVASTGSSGVANAAREWWPGSMSFKTRLRFGPS